MKKFLGIVAVLLLAACGAVDVSAINAEAARIKLHGKGVPLTIPVITSNGGGPTAGITITTAQTAVTTVTATGTTPITYSKSGADTALFSINASTGVLALLVPQAAADYHVTVTATNTAGADSQSITLTVTPPISTAGWMDGNIGAGGYVIQMSFADDGTKVAATDTYGGYKWTGSRWAQLFTASSMPAGVVQPASGDLVYQLAIAPNNSQKMYSIYGGAIIDPVGIPRRFYASTDQGVTWTQKTNFSTSVVTDNATFGERTGGPFMAVDPNNSDVVFFGDLSGGLYKTLDGGATFTVISTATIPAPTSAVFQIIVFDNSGSHNCGAGSQTCIVYVYSAGRGVYRSADGGSTWALTASSPTDVHQMKVSTAGVVFATNAAGSTINRYRSGTWAAITTTLNGYPALAADPNNASRIVVAGGGAIQTSLNADTAVPGSVTFTQTATTTCPQNAGQSGQSRTATDIPWLAVTNECYMSPGHLWFDPVIAGSTSRLWFSEGIGVWYYDMGGTATAPATTITWISQSLGIEQLVSNSIVSSPSAGPLYCNWDRPFFKPSVANPPVFPSSHGSTYSINISLCFSVDYAQSNTNFLAMVAQLGESSAYSSDGGTSWTLFGSVPSQGFGGGIAVADSTHFLWIPNSNGDINYTSNAGTTWTVVCVTSLPCTGSSSSSVTVGTGTKVFTVPTCAYLNWAGQAVALTSGVNSMSGTITSCTGTTLTTNITSVSGSGTLSSWVITLETGWGFSAFGQNRQIIAADRVTTNKMYAYNYGPLQGAGVFSSTDAGLSWTRVSGNAGNNSGKLDPAGDGFNAKLRSVPQSGTTNTAGHLIWTTGPSGHGNSDYGAFQYSVDGGATWTLKPTLRGVTSFGFGKNAPGQQYPVVYVAGFLNTGGAGTFGIYKSEDQLATWTAVSGLNADGTNCTTAYPSCNFDAIKTIEGDLNTYNRIWVGFSGAGLVVKQP